MNKKTLLVLLQIIPSIFFASVEHKDEFIDVYLSNISGNLDEKTQIYNYILDNLNGTYIDIGTGGDAIAMLAQKLPPSSRPTLIAADIDPSVIDSIKTRRKEILNYINKKEGPNVELVTMSAVNMIPIKDSMISGIGASAVAHEIYSYVPTLDPLDQFTYEVCRVLEKNGVFIYRDPKWVDDPETHCTMVVKKDIAKYYTSLFLTKFLDRRFSMIKDYRGECCKPNLYSENQVKVNAYLQNSKQSKQFSFQEFLNTPTHLIDYKRNFSVEAPKGLIAEIQRHYLMFVKNYFAPGFIDEKFFQQDLDLQLLEEEERKLLKDFALRKKLPLHDNIIKVQDFPLYYKDADNLVNLFKEDLTIKIKENEGLFDYIKNISFDDINRNLLFLKDDETLVIDPKMLTLLFHGKSNGMFNFLSNEADIPWDILEHLKLEGEEHYFYKTTDQLITYFGQFSRFILKDTHKKNYMLAPINPSEVKKVSRDFYKDVLNRDMLILNVHGDKQEPVTDKNIIHFKLQLEENAFDVYNQLITSDPLQYQSLEKWMSNVKQ
jgi:SAM-dependent methyltransferase